MKNLFNSVKMTAPRSNTFDLTHDVKFSARMGELVPVLNMECVPGDRISLGADSLVRFAPMIAPVMHRFNATIHYFFVPNRILWDGWNEWMETQGSSAVHPYVTIGNGTPAAEQRFAEYMGIPTPLPSGPSESLNAMPFAAYQKIYDDYYRDQNLISPVFNGLTDDANALGPLATMRKRAWMHDYFTAALPFAQKGSEVDIPLGDVMLKDPWATPGQNPSFVDSTNSPVLPVPAQSVQVADNTGGVSNIEVPGAPGGPMVAYDPDGTLSVEPTTINELRRAFRLQEWLEKMARGGSRYIEQILAHFGVKSSDKRLDRPEYITGVKTPVVVSEVLNTTGQNTLDPGEPGLPQGNMAGHAVSVGQGKVGSYFVEEHGWIIGIMSVTPLPAYQQGIFKPMSHRTSILDYYWPSFAHIGEQEIKNKEIYAYTNASEETFGYIPRYSEYRYMPNRVAGDFMGNLKYWHAGRIFTSPPALNQQFIEVDPGYGGPDNSIERIFAVVGGTDENLYIQIINKIKARRLMPTYGTPNL